jgi:hydrogenase maturation protein HypF
VLNSTQGVFIEAEGPPEVLRQFLLRIEREKPAISFIQSLEHSYLDPIPYEGFEIRDSADGAKTALILSDIATCSELRQEIFDPTNRRYRYPFTNCTNCGPRFTIVEALPYDRLRTSMRTFEMCPEGLEEYHDPHNRDFMRSRMRARRAGRIWNYGTHRGASINSSDEALRRTAVAIRDGCIVAVKGLGGFHLMVDASNEWAVRRLRQRQRREEKPLAQMFASLGEVAKCAVVKPMEERLLSSPEVPIVLLRHGELDLLAESVAPGNPCQRSLRAWSP